MLCTVADSFWDDLADALKITLDGSAKLIYIDPQYSSVSVKIDIYSALKRWLKRRQNAGYLTPIRAIGGDPVGATGQYAGDIYFLTNGWRIVIDHQVSINGILYSDNYASPYTVLSGGGVIANVSNLAYSYNTVGVTVPTSSDVAAAVWGTQTYTQTDVNTIGGQITKTKTTVDTIKITTDNILATNV